MSSEGKKTAVLNTTPSPIPPPTTQQTPKIPQPIRGPLLSRRAFILGAVGASALLTAGAFGASGQILGPVIPSLEGSLVIGDWQSLDNNYKSAVAGGNAIDPLNPSSPFAQFFYWPFDSSTSPYYKDVIVRLPDNVPLTSGSSVFTAPNGAKFVAYNVTCVHLRCLVNPGYAENEYRLICPCHGSQYRLSDGVPVRGPAFDLGLNPLPQVRLMPTKTGTGIIATAWDPARCSAGDLSGCLNGDPGVGRTQ